VISYICLSVTPWRWRQQGNETFILILYQPRRRHCTPFCISFSIHVFKFYVKFSIPCILDVSKHLLYKIFYSVHSSCQQTPFMYNFLFRAFFMSANTFCIKFSIPCTLHVSKHLLYKIFYSVHSSCQQTPFM
jgi:hypothetical protein